MDRGPADDLATPPSTRMFLVERYWPGIDEPGAWTVVSSLDAAARTMTAEGTSVEHVGSILMPADQVVFSLITAVDEADVRALNARAEAPLDRIAVAIGLGIGQSTRGER
jgi:hypothetical protein